MAEPSIHAMTNGKAEKVSDGLPNGVDSNEVESIHVDSVDFGQFNQYIHEDVDDMNKGFSAMTSAFERLTGRFQKYGDIVKTVDERYSTGQALEERIEELVRENEVLDRRNENIRHGNRVTLRNERVKYEEEISKLKSRADSGQREKKKYEELIETLKNDHAKAVQKAENDLAVKKAQLEKDNEEMIAKLKADNAKLEEKSTKLEQDLQKMTKLRDRADEVRDTMQGKAEAEIKSLKMTLDGVKARYEVPRLPVEHYSERYKLLVDSVASIASEYFFELPEDALNNPTTTYLQLIQKGGAFVGVPITDSDRARVLRLAHVQNIIFEAMQQSVWQPFFSRSIWKNSLWKNNLFKNKRSLLPEIYSRLKQDGDEIPNEWKVSTLKALDRLDDGVDVGDNIEAEINLHVIHFLGPLLSEQKEPGFRSELKNIFVKAMELGQEARRDQSPVYFDAAPPPNGGDAWKEFSKDFEMDDPLIPTPVDFRGIPQHPLCVSPRIYRERKREAASGGLADQEGDELVSPGVALFPNTGIAQQGELEWQEFEQSMRRQARKGHNNRTRRASVASTTNDLVPPQPPPESLRPSKTWASQTNAEYD